MKLLIAFALFLVGCVHCQTFTSATVTLGDLAHTSNLTLNLDASGAVTWSFNNGSTTYLNNFAVLGSTNCLPAVRMVRSGSNFLSWTCDTNQTGNGDQLINAIGGCSNNDSVPVLLNLTGYNDFRCYHDNDTLGDLHCGPNKIASSDGSGGWSCANDKDSFAASGAQCASLGLTAPSVAVFFPNDTYGCNPLATDNDTARDLLLHHSCTNGQIIKWNGTNWSCGRDNSLLTEYNCSVGQSLIFNTTGNNLWSCGMETDTLRDLIPTCIANGGTTPFRANNCTNLDNCVVGNSSNYNTYWDCIPTPISHLNPTLSMTTFTSSVVAGGGSTYPTGTGYTGLGGFPFSTPYKGNITGWALHVNQRGPISANLYLNKQLISSLSSSSLTPALLTNATLNIPFTPFSTFGFQVVNGYSAPLALTVDIFVMWTLN